MKGFVDQFSHHHAEAGGSADEIVDESAPSYAAEAAHGAKEKLHEAAERARGAASDSAAKAQGVYGAAKEKAGAALPLPPPPPPMASPQGATRSLGLRGWLARSRVHGWGCAAAPTAPSVRCCGFPPLPAMRDACVLTPTSGRQVKEAADYVTGGASHAGERLRDRTAEAAAEKAQGAYDAVKDKAGAAKDKVRAAVATSINLFCSVLVLHLGRRAAFVVVR